MDTNTYKIYAKYGYDYMNMVLVLEVDKDTYPDNYVHFFFQIWISILRKLSKKLDIRFNIMNMKLFEPDLNTSTLNICRRDKYSSKPQTKLNPI